MQSAGLFTFTDYRAFLVSYVDSARSHKKHWSLELWTKQLGLEDSSSVRKILKGSRHPGKKIIEKLGQFFQWNEKEAVYFTDLVRLAKIADDPRLSTLLLEKMGKTHPNDHLRNLEFEYYHLLSRWYCLPIKEMTLLPDFQENPQWIQERLNFKVSKEQVLEAINILLKAKLLKRDEKGCLRPSDGQIRASKNTLNQAVQDFHCSMLENASTALKKTPLEEREFFANSFNIRKENLPQAKELIRKFQREFMKLLEEDYADETYHIQTQFFPLTKREGQSKRSLS